MVPIYRTFITQVVRDALNTDIKFINETPKIKPNVYPAYTIVDIEEEHEILSITAQDYNVNIDVMNRITYKEDHDNVGQRKYLIIGEQMERLKRRLLTINSFLDTMDMVHQPELISVKHAEKEEGIEDKNFTSFLINIIYHLRYNMSKGLDAIEIYSKAQNITTKIEEM